VAKKSKKPNFDEGLVRGKKVFFLGALPVLLFLLFMGVVAFILSNFANKMAVNKDDGVCNSIRRQYSNSIDSDWSCDLADKGDYYLVTFNQSANTGQVAALMSFKYTKSTKAVEPALSVN